nr:MAG: division/cell wall cluster transcriptional repressor MraZ [Pseudomonadota bacterium]
MDSMFRGQFLHTIDAKGRVSLPARFRDLVLASGDARVVLAPFPFDPCVRLYPMRSWEDYERKISELSSLDAKVLRFKRILLSGAFECEIDRPGRVLVPQKLREQANLEKEVLWAGMGDFIELWSNANFERAVSMTEDEVHELRAAMEQLRL